MLSQPSVARQRVQREIMPIQVVFQIEHFRKSRSGKRLLVPGAIVVLVFKQIIDGALNSRIVRRQQRSTVPISPRPSATECSPLAHQAGIVVGRA